MTVRAYHFLNEMYGLENLRNGSLKVATIESLNDPFEMLSMSFADRRVRCTFRAAKARLAQRLGLLCFSESWRNPVQWSHYADHHRGLCLGFDLPRGSVRAIQYVDRRLAVNADAVIASELDVQKLLDEALHTKFMHWRYEKELRRLVPLVERDQADTIWLHRFGDDLKLREVIVGHGCGVSRTELAEALGARSEGVRCRKARLSFREFKVVEQMRASRWR